MSIPAKQTQVLDSEGVRRAMARIAHEIVERNHGTQELVFAGIRTRGVFIAERLQNQIEQMEKIKVPVGVLDITLYRDDLGEIGPFPTVHETAFEYDVNGKVVVLVDDVLYTGRTVRAAMDAVIDFGRPKAIQLAVLVDRGHRELPIKADYVGKNVPTAQEEEVSVKVMEQDKVDEVCLVRKQK